MDIQTIQTILRAVAEKLFPSTEITHSHMLGIAEAKLASIASEMERVAVVKNASEARDIAKRALLLSLSQ